MLIYELRVRDEFERLRSYAERLRAAFEADRQPSELLEDAKNLKVLADNMRALLPDDVRNAGNIGRHLAWMIDWLKKDNSVSCKQDIVDICEHDIADLEKAFVEWYRRPDHYDKELIDKIGDLIARREFDSAIRKGFVILRERLAQRYAISRDLDGPELVNRIYGKNSGLTPHLDDSRRQAVRDLLSGMYGVFRNKYAHGDHAAEWFEADAVLSMINFLLIGLGTEKSKS